jgi:hypothetical protein
MSDGEVFYHIGKWYQEQEQPAWPMPDQQIWHLVAYLHNLPKNVVPPAPAPTLGAQTMPVAEAHGLSRLQEMSRNHLSSLEHIEDAECRVRSARAQEALNSPNACNLCHADKTAASASAELKDLGGPGVTFGFPLNLGRPTSESTSAMQSSHR